MAETEERIEQARLRKQKAQLNLVIAKSASGSHRSRTARSILNGRPNIHDAGDSLERDLSMLIGEHELREQAERSMIQKAKENFPGKDFSVGNALDSTQFNHNVFTHILCLYFTIYYFPDKKQFFDNCMDWLMPGGYLIVHLVDREKFDPILPPGNPLYIVSPQKYAKERITTTKVTFNDFVYNSDFKFDKSANIATFDEKFKFNNGNVRKQEQKLYMEDTQDILTIAQQSGFILQGKIDLVSCAYDSQYLYILVKPN
jgi:SAM-dependent methyltransferase